MSLVRFQPVARKASGLPEAFFLLMNTNKSSVLIGTSGYDYPEWKGIFYPKNLKRADFLSYYATQFNALELNNTFYNMPTSERLLSFYERSQGQVQFSIKANRLLTHEISQLWQNAASDFIKAIEPLAQKDVLSAILFQLPQSFHYTNENRLYLAALIQKFKAFPVVVEFRHIEWMKPSVFDGLEKLNASLVYCDMPQLKYLPDGKTVQIPLIGENAYIRLHGRNEDAWYATEGSARYTYDYSEDELKSFVPVIQTAAVVCKKVHVFFNNHPDGNGAKNAQRIKQLIQPAEPSLNRS